MNTREELIMNKSVIFDMDGTLFQTEKILEESLNQTLGQLDQLQIHYINNPVEKYKELMGVPLDEVWKNLLDNPLDENIQKANEIFQKTLIFCIQSGKGMLYEAVEEVLGYIKSKQYDIFIASNGDVEYLNAIYEKYSLEQYIKNVYSINEIESSSKVDLIKHIIKEERTNPQFIVGDRLSDFQAGKENNINVIGCKFYFSKEEELLKADHVVNSLKDLKLII